MATVSIGDILVGKGQRPLLIAGPCVLEDFDIAFEIGKHMKSVADELGFSYLFKASFDKANRTSISSYRGPGLKEGLTILSQVKRELKCPVTTDIHEVTQAEPLAEVVDVIQIPAFLCRQTDLLIEAGKTGRVINIKKGQFLAPWDMIYPVEKVRSTGNEKIILTERGTCFGYNNLVVDMRSLHIMASFGCPVIFDTTHSVQLPGGGKGCSSGQRQFIPNLARAAAACGCDGIFMEVYPNPEKAKCDGANSLPLDDTRKVLSDLKRIFELFHE